MRGERRSETGRRAPEGEPGRVFEPVRERPGAGTHPALLSLSLPFGYHSSMKLDINTRGNGACPLCSSSGNCRIHRLLSAGVEKANAESAMELVVYSCPYFSEREGS